jgi:hypothetical protein
MNWGKSIVVVYTIFVIGIVFLVYKSSQQKIDLVDPNYYQQEIQFQKEIDDSNNANSHHYSAKIIKENGQELIVVDSGCGKILKGDAQFYCPSDSKKDVKMILPQTTDSKWKVPMNALKSASYKLKVKWSNEHLESFQSVIEYVKE